MLKLRTLTALSLALSLGHSTSSAAHIATLSADANLRAISASVASQESSTSREVRQIIADQLGLELAEVTLESGLINDLGADELDRIEIAMELELRYELAIPDKEIDSWGEVQMIVTYIENNT